MLFRPSLACSRMTMSSLDRKLVLCSRNTQNMASLVTDCYHIADIVSIYRESSK
jgi:hypothetical protein